MEREYIGAGNYSFFPCARVRLSRGDRTTLKFRSLVDSGSSLNLAAMGIGTDLGLSRQDIETGRRIELAPVGGVKIFAFEWLVDLVIEHTQSRLILENAKIYFTNAKIPLGSILLGQIDALERMEFFQRNHVHNQGGRPEFVLKKI